MSRVSKKVLAKREKVMSEINEILKELDSRGIHYDTTYCTPSCGYVVHVWIREEVKCNFWARTLSWAPFGYRKGISGQGLDELEEYLRTGDPVPKASEMTYAQKIKALREVLESVRNETNFDIIDDALEKYCT